MVKMEEAVVARYEHEGHTFELLVDPNLALEVKKNKEVSLNDLLAADLVFKDAAQGEEAAKELVQKTFQTQDLGRIAKFVIQKGEVQLTTEQRRHMVEKRRLEIVQMISRNAINPLTHAPHPEARIQAVMDEARVHIEPFASAQEQLEKILPEIKKILPLSFEQLQLAVKVAPAHAGKMGGLMRQYSLKREEWLNDGSYVGVIEVPAGMKTDVMGRIGKLTQGEAEIRILEEKQKVK